MNCSEVESHLPSYLSGELDESTASAVARHIDGCPACAAELRAQSELAEGLRSLCVPPMPEATEWAIYRRLAQHERPWTSRLRSVRVWSAAWALIEVVAALALFVILGAPR